LLLTQNALNTMTTDDIYQTLTQALQCNAYDRQQSHPMESSRSSVHDYSINAQIAKPSTHLHHTLKILHVVNVNTNTTITPMAS
jgi:hypothetical protein